MVAGHLQIKNDYYYIVLSYRDSFGKKKTKWISTGLKANSKKNEKLAEEELLKSRLSFSEHNYRNDAEILFSSFLKRWLEFVKSSIAPMTYSSYKSMVEKAISPFFDERGIRLCELKPIDVQEFYSYKLQTVKPNTVIHYHNVIHNACKYAVKMDLLVANPLDKVERPKKNHFEAKFYNDKEITKLYECSKGTLLEIPIFLASFYGLRRSEIVGLRWSAIDFENNIISINHTVTRATVDDKSQLFLLDKTKSETSRRKLPLVSVFKEKLLEYKEQQDEYKRVCGNCYNYEYEDYICVDPLGNLIAPDYISRAFPILLEKNGLRRIRFHDLRHSCASLLLANNVSMKQIQEWLGHSDFSTTANIYAHLTFDSKLKSADALTSGLNLSI